MSVNSKPSRRVDSSPQVTGGVPSKARRAARAGTGHGRARRFGWLADRPAIIAETVAAARAQGTASGAGIQVPPPAAPDEHWWPARTPGHHSLVRLALGSGGLIPRHQRPVLFAPYRKAPSAVGSWMSATNPNRPS